ncbi:MAG: hypothetical protein NVSMB25_05080 [Thermoleophilaceae bacterium]
MNSLFCRHNRFTADCPICSKGTVLDGTRSSAAPRPARSPKPSAAARRGAVRAGGGPYVSAGPYTRADGTRFEVRLERVSGGVRLASWSGGAIERRAPVLEARDLVAMLASARERSLLAGADLDRLLAALSASPAGETRAFGASAGRAGDFRDELRVEPDGDGTVRIARWILRPSAGWELQDAPVMLPAERLAEALEGAVAGGALVQAAP